MPPIVSNVPERASATRLRVDLHLHSSASFDCRVPPLEVARQCHKAGLSPIFITDHDGVGGAQELLDAGERVVMGQEILTSEGELIGLFLKEGIPKRLSPEETVAVIKEQGGLVCLEHPYDVGRRNLKEEAIERIADSIDIIEVLNGRSQPEVNRRAEELRATLGLAGGAGSDAHTVGEIGRVYVEIEPFQGPVDFLAKLRRARIVDKRRQTGIAARLFRTPRI